MKETNPLKKLFIRKGKVEVGEPTSDVKVPETGGRGQVEQVQVPLMMTQAMEQQLRDLGLDAEAINKLTPEEAWRIINEKKSEPEEEKEEEKPSKKNKKEIIQKTPEEQVADFISEFNLKELLPTEFAQLNKAQALKVVQDLKQRIVDIVKTDAQTRYSEYLKTEMEKYVHPEDNFLMRTGDLVLEKVIKSAKKETDLKNFENKVFSELRESEEGKKLIAENLARLTEINKGLNVGMFNEKPLVFYVDTSRDGNLQPTQEERDAYGHFNVAAGIYSKLPYEWGQEAKGKHKKEYEKAKADYEDARNKILELKSSKEAPENKGRVMLEMLQIDNTVQMEQLLNTHPEFEKALDDFEKSAGAREKGKTLLNLANTLTGGKGTSGVRTATNKLIFAGGYGARMLATIIGGSAASTTALVAAPLVGATVGGLRANIRAKDTLSDRGKDARHGKGRMEALRVELKKAIEEKDIEKKLDIEEELDAIKNEGTDNDVENAEKLTKKLEAALKMGSRYFERGGGEETEAEDGRIIKGKAEIYTHDRLDQLKRRIEFTKYKIENGLVNFGDSKSALVNQYNLVNSLNQALVTAAGLEESNRKDIDARVDRFLSYREGKVEKAQDAFIRKQTRNGILIGTGAAFAGYGLRYFGEQLGWFGHHAQAGNLHTGGKIAAGAVAKTQHESVTPHQGNSSEGFMKRAEDWMHGLKKETEDWASKHNPFGHHDASQVTNNETHEQAVKNLAEIKGNRPNIEVEHPNPVDHIDNVPMQTLDVNNAANTDVITINKGEGGTGFLIHAKEAIRAHYGGDPKDVPDNYKDAPESIKTLMSSHNAAEQSRALGFQDGDKSALLGKESTFTINYKTGAVTLKNLADGKENVLISGDNTITKYGGPMMESVHQQDSATHVVGSSSEKINLPDSSSTDASMLPTHHQAVENAQDHYANSMHKPPGWKREDYDWSDHKFAPKLTDQHQPTVQQVAQEHVVHQQPTAPRGPRNITFWDNETNETYGMQEGPRMVTGADGHQFELSSGVARFFDHNHYAVDSKSVVFVNNHPDFMSFAENNHFHLSYDGLEKAYVANQHNLEHIFPDHHLDDWQNNIGRMKATDILDHKAMEPGIIRDNTEKYIRTLSKVSNLKPKTFFGKETAEQFVNRATQKIVHDQGNLDSVTEAMKNPAK